MPRWFSRRSARATARSVARSDAELAIRAAEMGFDRLRRHDERLCNLSRFAAPSAASSATRRSCAVSEPTPVSAAHARPPSSGVQLAAGVIFECPHAPPATDSCSARRNGSRASLRSTLPSERPDPERRTSSGPQAGPAIRPRSRSPRRGGAARPRERRGRGARSDRRQCPAHPTPERARAPPRRVGEPRARPDLTRAHGRSGCATGHPSDCGSASRRRYT